MLNNRTPALLDSPAQGKITSPKRKSVLGAIGNNEVKLCWRGEQSNLVFESKRSITLVTHEKTIRNNFGMIFHFISLNLHSV